MHELRMEKLSAEAEVLKGVGPSSYPFREVENGLKTSENGCERRREGWIQVTVLTEMGGFLAHLERELAETKGDRDRLERELREHKAGKGARRPSHSLNIDEALRISWFLLWKAMDSRSSWYRKASNTLIITVVFELRGITFKDLMARELYDIEILFKLKQGQVEVAQAAVVTDYSDAIVIDQEVVECRNRRIADLGKDKVHILSKIKARKPKRARKILKTRPKGARNRGLQELSELFHAPKWAPKACFQEFRKSLSLLDWEHEMLSLQTTDLEVDVRDLDRFA